jgi:aryl sulfotransferase
MVVVSMTDPVIAAAASRPLGPGRIVWLASYPKSGNTWMRAIVTALGTHPHLFAVDHLGSGSQPFGVSASLSVYGLDARWLSYEEIDRLRTALIVRSIDAGEGIESEDGSSSTHFESHPPSLRKTHEIFRSGLPGAEPFPLEATRAAILVVRDPRDVACSYAPFFDVDLDTAIDAMARNEPVGHGNPAHSQTAQPWGSWSSHTLSWLSPDVPFPVHLVRYEDLREDAVATLEPVFAAVGLECTHEQLAEAVARARFERLQESESKHGFRETSPRTRVFFRSGRSGGWRDELSNDQVATIEQDHHEVMTTLGYDLETKPLMIQPLSAHIGLRVRIGHVPESIEGAVRATRFVSTTLNKTRVRFSPERLLYVEDGRIATLQWGEDTDDVSWVIQGWAVAIAMYQRGEFSLHASTVAIDDRVIAIAGRSGAGKSTTCMALRNRGHQLLVDDTTLLRFEPGGVFTTPYSRNVHLLPDSAEALGLDFEELPRLAGGRTKASFTPDAPPLEPRRIDRIVVLNPAEDCSEPSIVELHGMHRLSALRSHISRNLIASFILGEEKLFRLLTDLGDAVPVFELSRPKDGWSLDDVVRLIEER